MIAIVVPCTSIICFLSGIIVFKKNEAGLTAMLQYYRWGPNENPQAIQWLIKESGGKASTLQKYKSNYCEDQKFLSITPPHWAGFKPNGHDTDRIITQQKFSKINKPSDPVIWRLREPVRIFSNRMHEDLRRFINLKNLIVLYRPNSHCQCSFQYRLQILPFRQPGNVG